MFGTENPKNQYSTKITPNCVPKKESVPKRSPETWFYHAQKDFIFLKRKPKAPGTTVHIQTEVEAQLRAGFHIKWTMGAI
jgi:hypothetical protein